MESWSGKLRRRLEKSKKHNGIARKPPTPFKRGKKFRKLPKRIVLAPVLPAVAGKEAQALIDKAILAGRRYLHVDERGHIRDVRADMLDRHSVPPPAVNMVAAAPEPPVLAHLERTIAILQRVIRQIGGEL